MKSTDYQAELDIFYSSLGILNVPLELDCIKAISCWNGIEARMWSAVKNEETGNSDYAELYIPWIGTLYDKLKLLIIGINLNNCGGYDAETWLAEYAKDAILRGQRKINFGNLDYAGTLFWHRVAAYTVAFLENANLMKPIWGDDDFPSKEDIAEAFNYFAITNSIKCSPKKSDINDRSKPTASMWENCPKFILKQEIEILKPNNILICGSTENAEYFNHKTLDNPISLKNYGKTQRGVGMINGREVGIFIVPHPAFKISVEIMYSLINSLNDK